MGFFFCLPWLLILIPLIAGEDVDWYKESRLPGNTGKNGSKDGSKSGGNRSS